ncbi:hypothetical protein ACIG0C_04905 [Kitasatospora aureofaciens]|uniref:hypothetical protein n=1 Tax=Kitasatospora aureofaciens TaxID=1894 RepID=UPI0009A08374
MVTKRNSLRLAAVAALGALFLGTAGTAMAAAPAATDPDPVAATATAPAPAPAPAPVASAPVASVSAGITAKPSVTSVQAWQLFRVTGTTTGLEAGSTVTLQQKQHGTWVTLPASVHTTRNGSYSLGVKLGIKGLNELRIVSGNTASPVFTVTVR